MQIKTKEIDELFFQDKEQIKLKWYMMEIMMWV